MENLESAPATAFDNPDTEPQFDPEPQFSQDSAFKSDSPFEPEVIASGARETSQGAQQHILDVAMQGKAYVQKRPGLVILGAMLVGVAVAMLAGRNRWNASQPESIFQRISNGVESGLQECPERFESVKKSIANLGRESADLGHRARKLLHELRSR